MSQYGAYGYAQHGSTFDQILAHYYPGTTLGPAPASTIRVLLADKKKKLTIASDCAVHRPRRRRARRITLAAGHARRSTRRRSRSARAADAQRRRCRSSRLGGR